MSTPILHIVENPDTAIPTVDSSFARVCHVQIGGNRFWNLQFGFIHGGDSQIRVVDDTMGDSKLLGRLHPWGREGKHPEHELPKYMFMSRSSFDILKPLMSVPVVEYTLEPSLVMP